MMITSAELNLYQNDFLWHINPYVRKAFYDRLVPHQVIGERIIYDYELLYIKSGRCVVTIEDQQYETRPGDLFFFRPGMRHSIIVFDEPLIQPHIHFDLVYTGNSIKTPISFINYDQMTDEQKGLIQSDIIEGFFKPFPNQLRLKNTQYVEQLLFSIITTFTAPTLFPEIELKWRFLRLLNHLFSEISWMMSRQKNHNQERLHLIKMYLEHYTDHAVTLDELANVYHIDRSYISRSFKAEYGVSPIHYQLLVRISKAKSMIINTNLTLTDIATKTGFLRLQDFSRAFKRIEGVSPSFYRKN